jgi:phosphatidate cytidylyltransferase
VIVTTRVLTAMVGIPILLVAIWSGAPWFTIVVLLAAALGVREIYNLAPSENFGVPYLLGMLWAIALVLGGQATSEVADLLLILSIISLSGTFVVCLWLITYYRGPNIRIVAVYLVGGPLVIGFLLAHALALRGMEGGGSLGRDWLLLALLVTFATDTGAFIIGRSIGRKVMAPIVSPNKTWEGSVGGFVFAVAAALAMGQLLDLTMPFYQLAIVGATVGVIAQLGDIAESKVKRISGAKDAGSIIPGHGGILDRLDSIVVSLPAVYYLVTTVFEP